jgi:hypothetical protein
MPANNLLDISLTANDGTNHIYISGNTSLNVLTLTLTNTTIQTQFFQQYSGNNCAIGALASTDTGIYLLFNGMLANIEISGITCNKAGWTLFSFSDNQNGTYLVLTTQSTVQLAAGESLSFDLQLPAVSGSAGSGYCLCQCVNLLYTYPISCGQQLYITKVYPPREDGTAAAQLPVQFEFLGGNILYSGKSDQQLIFRITNTSAEALVPGGKASWGTSAPQFRLSFIEDGNSAPGSLFTHSQAGGIKVDVLQDYENTLQVTPETDDSPVNWVIDEPSDDSSNEGLILKTGTAASVTFKITEIVTSVPPSVTMAVLSYSGFPGYPDGQLTAEIVILSSPPEKPVVNHFTISPSVINISRLANTISLSWNVSNASQITILRENTVVLNSNYTNASTSVSVTQTTTFTLIASNTAGDEVVRNVTIQVDTVPIGTIMMWSGPLASVPTAYGWQVCDGNNGTPDLRERFVLGATTDVTPSNSTLHSLHQTGGGETHCHSFTVNSQQINITNDGYHTHSLQFKIKNTLDDDSNSHDRNYYYGSDDTVTTDGGSADGKHNHTFTVNGQTHNTSGVTADLPPYYALYFIMKCE